MKCEFNDCPKKLQLVDTISGKCKCTKTFCALHRLAENHECTYNHKTIINAEYYILKNKCVRAKIAAL